jgi:glycosyltransferase involved in cell wall biosynthesis
MKKVSIVLPAHNEGKSIYETLNEIQQKISNYNQFEYEIFVSEDGSKDNTREEVSKIAEISKIKIQLSPQIDRLGYSKAILRAISLVNSEIIVFMDSDGQYDPSEIPNLLTKLETGRIVVGYRNPRVDSKLRILYSNAFKVVFFILFRLKLKDPSSPFIAVYKSDIDFLAKTDFYLAYGFWWEFQARINRKQLKITELPVIHRNRIQGETQVYTLNKLPRIVRTHLIGLFRLKKEIG